MVINLLLHALPVIGYRIVHMHRIPHNICEETYGIIMELLRARDQIRGLVWLFGVGKSFYFRTV